MHDRVVFFAVLLAVLTLGIMRFLYGVASILVDAPFIFGVIWLLYLLVRLWANTLHDTHELRALRDDTTPESLSSTHNVPDSGDKKTMR